MKRLHRGSANFELSRHRAFVSAEFYAGYALFLRVSVFVKSKRIVQYNQSSAPLGVIEQLARSIFVGRCPCGKQRLVPIVPATPYLLF